MIKLWDENNSVPAIQLNCVLENSKTRVIFKFVYGPGCHTKIADFMTIRAMVTPGVSVSLTLVMANINLYLYNPQQVSASCPFEAIFSDRKKGNDFTGVCHSVHNRPHGYLVTAYPCYSAAGTHPTRMLSC